VVTATAERAAERAEQAEQAEQQDEQQDEQQHSPAGQQDEKQDEQQHSMQDDDDHDATAAKPSIVQQLVDYLETHKQPPPNSSHKQLYRAWMNLIGKKQANKKAFEEAVKGKATASQLYSAALEKADAAKAKKGANAKSK
jgi:hypothetical protein